MLLKPDSWLNINMADLLGFAFTAGIVMLMLAGSVLGIVAFKTTIATGAAYDLLGSTLTMFTNFAAQLGTVGTMLGVGLIVGVIGIAFVGVAVARNKGYV